MKHPSRKRASLGRCAHCATWGRLSTIWAQADDGALRRIELVCVDCYTTHKQLDFFAVLDASR